MTNTAYVFIANAIFNKINPKVIPRGAVDDFGKLAPINQLEFLASDGTKVQATINSSHILDARTLHRVGNSYVLNRSFGWHPDYATVIVCMGQPDTDVVERYRRFYGEDPSVTTVETIEAEIEALMQLLPVRSVLFSRNNLPKYYH